jgi:hypothetical protein
VGRTDALVASSGSCRAITRGPARRREVHRSGGLGGEFVGGLLALVRIFGQSAPNYRI